MQEVQALTLPDTHSSPNFAKPLLAAGIISICEVQMFQVKM